MKSEGSLFVVLCLIMRGLQVSADVCSRIVRHVSCSKHGPLQQLLDLRMRVYVLLGCLWIASASTQAAPDHKNIEIQDFGDANAKALWQSFRDVKVQTRLRPLRILQLGDSHTAGDYFTGQLRQSLQRDFGNAGIGWLTPGFIPNQRSAQVLLRQPKKWQVVDSKQPKHTGTFPLGGLIQKPTANSALELKIKEPIAPGPWTLHLWQQAPHEPWQVKRANGKLQALKNTEKSRAAWRHVEMTIDGSQLDGVKLLAPKGGKLAGIVLDKNAPGVTLDALGITGSVAAVINRWDVATLKQQLSWRSPELIILAYGTNEAFSNDFQVATYEQELVKSIRLLRQLNPKAAVLLVGAPASAKNKPPFRKTNCSLPLPPALLDVQRSQLKIAKQEKTLYWDWAAAMGGNCIVNNWLKQTPELMRPDMVHLSKEGYYLSADRFYQALQQQINTP